MSAEQSKKLLEGVKAKIAAAKEALEIAEIAIDAMYAMAAAEDGKLTTEEKEAMK